MLERFFLNLHSVTSNLDMMKVFIAWKSANVSTQDLFLPENGLLNIYQHTTDDSAIFRCSFFLHSQCEVGTGRRQLRTSVLMKMRDKRISKITTSSSKMLFLGSFYLDWVSFSILYSTKILLILRTMTELWLEKDKEWKCWIIFNNTKEVTIEKYTSGIGK